MARSPVIELAHPTLRVDTRALRSLIRLAASSEGYELGDVSVVLGDHELVLDLNRQYLEHDYLTDVLAFNYSESADTQRIEGEIYVDLDTASERCTEFEVTFEEEVSRYVIHGLLHLMGYEDHTPEGKAAMHVLEDRYLKAGE